ncbi:MAG: AAA family ATPase [Fibrobacter sp.]|nr:AAA family ATPase [Fibrobacter sp.]
MDSRYYVENFLQKNGFSEAKADETIIGTSKVLDSSQYIAASRNRLNSGILRNECVVLLNPISNEDHLNDAIFSGISKLRDDQYVLVQQYPEESLWNVYQGFNFNGMMKLIQKKISLEMFLVKRHLANQNKNIPSKAAEEKKQEMQLHSQIIYYGVPGCGKSNTIKEQLKNVPDFNKISVVFHPDYTNAEFIGQIKPKLKNHSVSYEFTPGPFAKILRRAYLNPNQNFYLVIDEINRGQASAILGEVFQLCDRIKPNDDKDEFGYGAGWSVYGIDHDDMNDYIRSISSYLKENHDGCETPVEYTPEDGRGEVSAYKSIDINWPGFGETGKLHFSEITPIRLPPNLSILATMNTSDQNVFTLDNAFQRRFDMELVRNEFAKDDAGNFKTEAVCIQHDAKIAGTETSWSEFWEWANRKMTILLKGLSSTEDKRLGVWFVCNVNGEISEKIFAEKVLKYLWDDAFKFKRPQIFIDGCDTLENLISKFHEVKFGVFKNFGN